MMRGSNEVVRIMGLLDCHGRSSGVDAYEIRVGFCVDDTIGFNLACLFLDSPI
jgi:hypothetical protein